MLGSVDVVPILRRGKEMAKKLKTGKKLRKTVTLKKGAGVD